MQHYLARASPAQRRRCQATRDRNRIADTPERLPIPPRQEARIVVEVDGQRFEAVGRPGRRCDRFNWLINGSPFRAGGLEAVWREIQRVRLPALGLRNLA